jgi:Transglycosylase SLT domain
LKFILQISIALALIGASPAASAADLAVLRNGNSIRHERREVVGAVTRLYLSDTASGYIEIPTDQIERFEKDTAPPLAKTQPLTAGARVSTQPARVSNPFTPAAQPQPTAILTRQGLTDVINGAGERHQIDPDFINSVIRAESGFHQNAVSKKGAQGLMQLMPGTASQLGVTNTFDPKSNVEGGTTYLRALLEKYNYDVPKALAAYNAGPGRVDKFHGVPPYYETEAYISRIIRDFNRRKIAENPALAKKAKSAPTRTLSGAQHRTHAAATANGVPKSSETASK